MTRIFRQRRAQAQWSDTALTSADECPACAGHMVGVERLGVVTLICESCSRKWQMELGKLYEITAGPAVAVEQCNDWTELVQPDVATIEEE